jgi:hypothetical protein
MRHPRAAAIGFDGAPGTGKAKPAQANAGTANGQSRHLCLALFRLIYAAHLMETRLGVTIPKHSNVLLRRNALAEAIS